MVQNKFFNLQIIISPELYKLYDRNETLISELCLYFLQNSNDLMNLYANTSQAYYFQIKSIMILENYNFVDINEDIILSLIRLRNFFNDNDLLLNSEINHTIYLSLLGFVLDLKHLTYIHSICNSHKSFSIFQYNGFDNEFETDFMKMLSEAIGFSEKINIIETRNMIESCGFTETYNLSSLVKPKNFELFLAEKNISHLKTYPFRAYNSKFLDKRVQKIVKKICYDNV